MKILAVSGSARRGSFNAALAHRITDIRTQDQVVVRSDLDRLPFFNADLESTRIPPLKLLSCARPWRNARFWCLLHRSTTERHLD